MKCHTDENNIGDFYIRLFANFHVFETISKANSQKLDFLNIEIDQKEVVPVDTLNDTEEYILSFVDSRQALIKDLFLEMHKMQFAKVSSVNGPLSYLGYNSSRQEMLKKINLHDHTLNACIIAVEELSAKGTPTDLISIILIIVILHDFGKSPIIASKYREEGNNNHCKISANYAKEYLINYIRENKKSNINSKIIDQIYETLYYHHDMNIEKKTVFLTLLTEIDQNAREQELHFIRSMELN